MMSRNPLFLGLVRPPMTLGLPAAFWPVVMALGLLPLIWLKSLVAAAGAGLSAYIAARLAAAYEPRLLELLQVSSRCCPRLRTYARDGGNRYEP